MRRLAALLFIASLALGACKKKNPNLDPPAPYDGKAATHHKFDGGVTDPHSKGTDSGEGAGGESN